MVTPRFFAVLIVLIILIGCSTSTQQPKGPQAAQDAASQPATKEPTLYTAKQCFSSMVNLAQRWQLDALPFHVESEVNSEATGQNGKATVWRGFFASRTRGTMKSFACSGSLLSSSPASGFTDSPESPYAANVHGLPFDPANFLIDSDKAFSVTLEHGGEALIKKDPKQPVLYSLDWNPKRKDLTWLVIYGKSGTDRQGICSVSARTGAFVSAGK